MWGPEGKRSAIAVTFDNFGEAFDLQFGRWQEDEPVGQHPTATQILPRLLSDLELVHVPATFFVEGWNAENYPDALQRMRDGGHEVALHGWQHEVWAWQSPEERQAILSRSVTAMEKIGITPRGFRPPGGATTDDTNTRLSEAGFTYISPDGSGITTEQGITTLPFAWPHVDAFYVEDNLGYVREQQTGRSDLLPLSDWKEALDRLLSESAQQEKCSVLIFHPYLMIDEPDRYSIFREFVRKLGSAENIWSPTCFALSDWLAASPS